jgi:diguanylate cyclase (GGDEF)-like protein
MSRAFLGSGSSVEYDFVCLSQATEDGKSHVLPRAVVVLSLLVLVALVPFARVQLGPMPAFIPAYESVLIFNDLITCALLFGQYAILRSRSLFVLASGYLFTATIALLHMLSFPGLFSATGLLGAGMQSTAWMYLFWHAGFPLFVIVYVFVDEHDAKTKIHRQMSPITCLFAAGAAIVLAAGFAALATAGQNILPNIMNGNHYTPIMIWAVGTAWVLCLLALAAMWFRKRRTILDGWLMVVLCVWICDIALSAVFNGGRYDVGFYAGRLFGLCAASFILVLLLVENSFLYARLAMALAELKRLASIDPLTGVANRRTFESALDEAWRRHAQIGSSLSLLMIDVDYFKRFNDEYGHVEGDRCLNSVADCLVETARHGDDLVARYGGEEFSVLLPETDAASAMDIAQRMCDAVAGLGIPNAKSSVAPHVTISVGAASQVVTREMHADDLTRAADSALYAAKEAGRGRAEKAPGYAQAARPAADDEKAEIS